MPKRTNQDSQAGGSVSGRVQQLEQVTVTARRLSLIGTAQTASEGVVVNDELTLTPAYRPGQVLGTVPGLDVTVHSGEGKANQYLMRGYTCGTTSRIPTQDRITLTPEQLAAVDYPADFSETDKIHLGSVAGYIEITSHWTDAFRSVVGLRENYMYGIDSGTWAGSTATPLAEPKLGLIYRLNDTTELYASGGRGFHSDDLRGVMQARDQGVYGAPLIVGQDSAGPGSRRTGHVGEYLPNAPFATGSFNAYLRNLGRWSGGIAYRYLGAYPLTSGPCSNAAVQMDYPGLSSCAQAPTAKNEVFGSGYGEWSADVRYDLGRGWSRSPAA